MATVPGRPPFYARLLRLRNIRPGVVSCFLFLEGTLVLSGLVALAGLVSPWVVLVLPLAVAAAVKINDVVAGATSGAAAKPAASRGSRSERSHPDRSSSSRSMPGGSRSQRSDPTRPTDSDWAADSMQPTGRSWSSGSTQPTGSSWSSQGTRPGSGRPGKPTSQDLLMEKLAADREQGD
ncbi:MAG: hypothetical protein DLM59_00855 [Pseudonocardiales bacterium]|nr:MAG: hypothetical protein DLM59_00855 [Pseudonocardiales bacterium]